MPSWSCIIHDEMFTDTTKKTICGALTVAVITAHVLGWEYYREPHVEPSAAQDFTMGRDYGAITTSASIIAKSGSPITVSGSIFVTAARSV